MRAGGRGILGVAVGIAALASGCASSSGASSAAMTVQMNGASASAGSLVISKAYIPQPASPDVAVLYFTAVNSGSTPLTLTGVSTDGAASAGYDHYVTAAGGGEEMMPLATIVVPAHGRIELSPDHDHVMLQQPKDLKEGDTVNVAIEVAGSGSLSFAVPVVPITGLDNMPGMKMGN
jgi:copper(I)-binding protein